MQGLGRHRPVPLGHKGVRGQPLLALQCAAARVSRRPESGDCPPGPPPGSVAFLIASRNMPVSGDAESIVAEMVYVSVPIEFWLVLANNSPGESKENVVPLREDSLWIETRVCALDNVGDA